MKYLFFQDLLKLPEVQKLQNDDTLLTQIMMDLGLLQMMARGQASFKGVDKKLGLGQY